MVRHSVLFTQAFQGTDSRALVNNLYLFAYPKIIFFFFFAQLALCLANTETLIS